MGMQKKIARVFTEESFPRLFQKELTKAKLIGLPKKVNGLTEKVDNLSTKVDGISNRMDEMADAAKIIRENEQNLKDLGGLKHRLDTLDNIMVTVDKIAGGVQAIREEQTLHANIHDRVDLRIDRLEKHTNLVPLAD